MAKKVVLFRHKRHVELSCSMTAGGSGRLKGMLASVLTGILVTGVLLAQDSAQASPPANISDQQARSQAILADMLTARTPVHVSLVKPVDARKNKTGGELIVTTAEELRSQDGAVVIPAGAAIVGLITEVTLRSTEGQERSVEIAVDHVLLTDGSKASLARALQIIGRSRPTDSNEVEHESPIDQQARTAEAMRALATPASMGGGMLSDTIAVMAAAANPMDAVGMAEPLTSRSQGVIGLPDLRLSTEVAGSTPSTVKDTQILLSKGTEMMLRVNGR